jgi:hypothetical protein
LDGRALGAPRGVKRQAAVGNIAADQKTPRPFPGEVVVVFAAVEIGQLEIGPVVPARTFGPLRCFCRLKDFRRVATRYDKLARNFMAAVHLAAIVAYWIN